MSSDFGTSRSRPSLSMALVLVIVLLDAASIVGAQLPWRHWVPLWMTYALGWGHLLANFAIASIGIRTPQRGAWLIYLGVSVVTFVALGVTPLVALWFLPALLKSVLG